MLQHKLVQAGQDAAVEAYAVFHHQNHLHAGALNIMLQVHLVLNQFDDGKEQFGVAQPAEHVFKCRQIFVLHASGNTVAEGSQHYDWGLRMFFLDGSCNLEYVIVLGGGHTDDEVDISACHLYFRFL